MPPDYRFDDEVTSAETFSAVLGQLLVAARGNGVDVRGSWVHRDGEPTGNWEVSIVELAGD